MKKLQVPIDIVTYHEIFEWILRLEDSSILLTYFKRCVEEDKLAVTLPTYYYLFMLALKQKQPQIAFYARAELEKNHLKMDKKCYSLFLDTLLASRMHNEV
jgi:hypothetical protein